MNMNKAVVEALGVVAIETMIDSRIARIVSAAGKEQADKIKVLENLKPADVKEATAFDEKLEQAATYALEAAPELAKRIPKFIDANVARRLSWMNGEGKTKATW